MRFNIDLKLRSIAVFSIISLLTVPSQALTPEVTQAELTRALATYQDLAELEVDFHQTKFLKDMVKPLKAQGRLKLRRDTNEVVWTILKPAPLEVNLNPSEIKFTTGSGAGKQTQTIKRDQLPLGGEAKNLQALVDWLKLDPKLIARDYRVEKINANQYRFEPRQTNAVPFAKIELSLIQANGQLEDLKIFERTGDRVELKFGNPRLVKQK